MRSPIFMIVMMLCLFACGPTENVPPDVDSASPQLLTPIVPTGAFFLDACTHMVSYPEAIPPLDASGLIFTAAENPNVSVIIQARRRTTEETGLTAEEIGGRIQENYSSESKVQAFAPFVVTNYLGEDLTSLIGEFINTDGNMIRLLVVIQPDMYLMDMVADDIVYVIAAQAPRDEWDQWADPLDLFFQSFHPAMCGGV